MDKSTLSNYGWIVAVVVVLAIMVSLATPFGQVIRSNVESQVTKLQGTASGALDAAGGASSFDDLSGGGSGGSAVPEPQDGETYEDGDYIYKYNQYYALEYDEANPEGFGVWYDNASQGGWGVHAKENKSSYGAILSSIKGKPVNTLSYTFANYDNLDVAPAIPNSVTNMQYTFFNCLGLIDDVSIIPEGVTNMEGTFSMCCGLTVLPTIPSSVTNMSHTFDCCCAVTGTIEINANPTVYDGCLSGTQITEVTGSTTLKTELLATK